MPSHAHLRLIFSRHRFIEAREQMLLLNLLGGRLPMGYRMAGANPSAVQRNVQDRLDRVLRRMVRVAALLDEAMTGKDES
jgi:hypothetical protein